jgi:hypothetical protein
MGSMISKDAIQTSTLTKTQLLALIQDQRIKEKSKNMHEYIYYEVERKDLGLQDPKFDKAITNFLQSQPIKIPYTFKFSKGPFNMSETLTFQQISNKWTDDNLDIHVILNIDTTLLQKYYSKAYLSNFTQVMLYFEKILYVNILPKYVVTELRNWFSEVIIKEESKSDISIGLNNFIGISYRDPADGNFIYLFSIIIIPESIKYGNGIELKSFYKVEYHKLNRSVDMENLLIKLGRITKEELYDLSSESNTEIIESKAKKEQ